MGPRDVLEWHVAHMGQQSCDPEATLTKYHCGFFIAAAWDQRGSRNPELEINSPGLGLVGRWVSQFDTGSPVAP